METVRGPLSQLRPDPLNPQLGDGEPLPLEPVSGPDTDPAEVNLRWQQWGAVFNRAELTPVERSIIFASILQEMTDPQIAEFFGYHRVTIQRHRQEAFRKIRKAGFSIVEWCLE